MRGFDRSSYPVKADTSLFQCGERQVANTSCLAIPILLHKKQQMGEKVSYLKYLLIYYPPSATSNVRPTTVNGSGSV